MIIVLLCHPTHSDPLLNLADSLLWHAHPHSIGGDASDLSVSDIVFVAAAAARSSSSGTIIWASFVIT